MSKAFQGILDSFKKKVTSTPAKFGVGALAGALAYRKASSLISRIGSKKEVCTYVSQNTGIPMEEAERLYESSSKYAPGAMSDRALAKSIVSSVANSGGMTYPVATSLMEINNEYNSPRATIDPIRVPSSLYYSTGGGAPTRYDTDMANRTSTSIKPWVKTSGFGLGSLSPLLYGAGLTAAGIGAAELIRMGGEGRAATAGWNKLVEKYRIRIAMIGVDKARQYFDVLVKMSKEMAGDPDVAINFIQHMHSQGGVDLHTLKNIAKVRDPGGNRAQRIISGINAVGGLV